jgi:group II intron reverse transcriptase/maturase
VASSGLEGVRQRAKKDKTLCFNNLLHHITPELLRQSFYDLKRDAAPGIDGVSWKEYEQGLEERLKRLHEEVHRGSYRALPVRRTYIPKENGTRRPLGVTAIEDKIVQGAVVKVLLPIYDADMLGFSYGFRIGKSQHMALDALAVGIERHRIRWVLDADIKAFFDQIPHSELMRLVQLRVSDERILRLIRKWLKTGYSEDGVIHRQEIGTPQGSVISPFLANIYLHYVLDLWVEYERKSKPAGEVVIVRYADDFVIGFEHKATAERYLAELRDRFTAFGLTLHPEKTRLIEFGRYAASNRKKRDEDKPETFNFLGFTHICSTNRRDDFFLKRITIRKRLCNKIKEITENLRKRMHRPVHETGGWLGSVLRGIFNYYGVPGNVEALRSVRKLTARVWFKMLRRRSQKAKALNWDKFNRFQDSYLPHVQICHPFPNVRFDARYSR